MMWQTLRELHKAGKELPRNVDEAQAVLLSSPQGRARAQNAQMKAMRKRHKKTGKLAL